MSSILSQRGLELAKGESLRDKFASALLNLYDPDTNPDGFVNIGVAENYAMLNEVATFIKNKPVVIEPRELSYNEGPWGTIQLRTAMAKHMNRLFHSIKPVKPEELLFTNGLTPMCEMLGWAIGDPNNGILLPKPIYQAFQGDFGMRAMLKPIFVSFDGIDQFSPAAAEKYEFAIQQSAALGIKARALILCNPHNPLGRCYPRETIIALMRVCAKYNIHLLSDETYAMSFYEVDGRPPPVPFHSVLSFDVTPYIDPCLVHVLYGLSKDFAGGGLRLGCIHTRSELLMRVLSKMSSFYWAGNPDQKIAATILEDEAWLDKFFTLSRERLAKHSAIARNILDAEGIPYDRASTAGFFLWVDLRKFLPGVPGGEDPWKAEAMVTGKLIEAGVYVTDGASLAAEEPGWVRLIFSADEATLREGLKRIVKILKG